MDINLGQTRDYREPCCVSPSSDDKDKMYYPSLYIDGINSDALKDLPAEGTLTIKYRTVEKSVSNRGEKTNCRLELEVQAIVGATAEKPKNKSEAFDDLAKSVIGETDEDSDSE